MQLCFWDFVGRKECNIARETTYVCTDLLDVCAGAKQKKKREREIRGGTFEKGVVTTGKGRVVRSSLPTKPRMRVMTK